MFRVVASIVLLAWRGDATNCLDIQDCVACANHTYWGMHTCEWCFVSGTCHTVGSQWSPCAPGLANDQCISQSFRSSCGKDPSVCQAVQPTRPTQIHLSLAGPTGMRVAWRTTAMPREALVIFGDAESQVQVKAERSVQYLRWRGAGYGYHHVATLAGLRPGATYSYRVVCDGARSEPRTFKVAPPSGTPASFMVVGDLGYGAMGEAVDSRRRLEALKDSSDTLIHLGDIGYADDTFLHPEGAPGCFEQFCYESAYDKYMDWMENITDSLPYMVVAGNHEVECHSPACLADRGLHEPLRNFTAYHARFAMPSKESGGVGNMWYSFDYGPVHFVAVDTETDFDGADEADYGGEGFTPFRCGHFAPDGEYLRWLEADLAAASQRRDVTPWIVALGHRSWLWLDARKRDSATERAHSALFEKYGVDLYLAGHVHSYHRFLPINGSKGTPIVVSGGAGCDEFSLDLLHHGAHDFRRVIGNLDTRVYWKTTQVGMLEATPTSLDWRAIESKTGDLLDTVRLRKGAEPVAI